MIVLLILQISSVTSHGSLTAAHPAEVTFFDNCLIPSVDYMYTGDICWIIIGPARPDERCGSSDVQSNCIHLPSHKAT
jgi:hypothetical protein